MLKVGIFFNHLPDEQFDKPFSESTGAATIFGATGGVMEAALRTVSEILDKKPLENVEFNAVRGVEGIKEATVKIGGMDVKVAIAHGLGNARKLLNDIREGKADYHFIEIMACPGGCVTGGGQPIRMAKVHSEVNLKTERAKALYQEDRNLPIRKSHENPVVQHLYKNFLGEPGSHIAHELLHTHYIKRDKF